MQASSVLTERSTAARLADAVLRAWIGGDGAKLRRELENSLDSSEPLSDVHPSDERLDLLRGVASRMMGFPEPADIPQSDPEMRVCIRLLSHLASTPGYPD